MLDDCRAEHLGTSGVVVADVGVLRMRACSIQDVRGNGVCLNGQGQILIEDSKILEASKPALAVEKRASAVIRGRLSWSGRPSEVRISAPVRSVRIMSRCRSETSSRSVERPLGRAVSSVTAATTTLR